MDTTSVALTILRPDQELVSSILDEMLEYVDADGIMQVIIVAWLSPPDVRARTNSLGSDVL